MNMHGDNVFIEICKSYTTEHRVYVIVEKWEVEIIPFVIDFSVQKKFVISWICQLGQVLVCNNTSESTMTGNSYFTC
mgnify:CR=1 FL=1